MKYTYLFIALFFVCVVHAQVADTNKCVQVTVSAINSKTGKAIHDFNVIITGKTGYASHEYSGKNTSYKTCLQPSTYEVFVSKDRYLNNNTPNRYLLNLKEGDKPVELTFVLDSIVPRGCPIIPTVLFEKGSYTLSKMYKDSLNGIVKTMIDNPNIVFQLMASTDSRGSAASNMNRSKKYGKVIKNYLLSHGIARRRVEIKAYGETLLVNHCSDGVECTEEEHAINNRVAFRIIRNDYKNN